MNAVVGALRNRLIDLLDVGERPGVDYGNIGGQGSEAFWVRERSGLMHICYQGEWFTPTRPTLRTRLRNWLVSIENAHREKDPTYR